MTFTIKLKASIATNYALLTVPLRSTRFVNQFLRGWMSGLLFDGKRQITTEVTARQRR